MHTHSSSIVRHRGVAGLLLMLITAVAAALAAAATAASAAEVAASCKGTQNTEASPGLKLDQQATTQRTKIIFSSCEVTGLGEPPETEHGVVDFTSGGGASEVTGNASCVSLFDDTVGTSTFVWNNHEASDFEYTESTFEAGGLTFISQEGRIIAGEFVGRAAEAVVTPTLDDPLDCLTSEGLTSYSGDIELRIYV